MLIRPHPIPSRDRVPALWSFFGKVIHARLVRQIEYLKIENEILRTHVPKQRIVVSPAERDLLVRFGVAVGEELKDLIRIVTYATFRRWLRERAQPSGEPKQRRGCPRTPADIAALIVQLARENIWGYSRIRNELRRLGIHAVCRTTIKNILIRAGLPTNPERGREGWDHFVRRHLDTLVACDFFTKDIWTPLGRRYAYVLVFIHVGTRKVYASRSTFHPNSAWVAQQARNVLMHLAEEGLDATLLLRDRDAKFTRQFDEIFASEGIQVKPLPIRSPNLNAYCEAWIGSLKWECLNHFICFGQTHLDYVLREYVEYYNTVRPHSAMGDAPLTPHEPIRDGPIRRDSRLGGLLNHYYREAA